MSAAHSLPQLAGPAFASSLWQGTLLAAAVWLCLRLVPKAAAARRFALWTAALLAICILPLIESLRPLPLSAAHHPLLRMDPRFSLALACLWAACSLLRGCSLAFQCLHLWKLRRQALPVTPSEAIHSLLSTSSRPVELCTSAPLDRPGIIGFFRPRILIPAWLYPQLTPPELEQVVLHEVEHLRRRDDWLNLLQKITLVLFPLNPVLVLIERLLCRERELACDDGVLRRTRAPRAYAACLATLAERGLTHRTLSLALGALGHPRHRSELYHRVSRILATHAKASPFHTQALTAAVTLILVVGSVALVRCPQLVSFTASPLQVATARPVPTSLRSITATVPPASLVKASLRRTPKRKPHLSHIVAHPPAPRATRFVLTAWPETVRARVLTLDFELPAYTAVRVEGGWLLLQL